MRKKKVLGLMLSFTLAFGLALPATMAMPLESAVTVSDSNANATDSNVMATDRNVTSTDSNATETDSNATENVVEHIATCLEGCTGEDCECVCHVPSLFERLMATETIEEFEQIIMETPSEEIHSLTDEQLKIINDHIKSIEPEPLSAIVIEPPVWETVQSEIFYPTVTFTEVAPLGDPVVGKVE